MQHNLCKAECLRTVAGAIEDGLLQYQGEMSMKIVHFVEAMAQRFIMNGTNTYNIAESVFTHRHIHTYTGRDRL